MIQRDRGLALLAPKGRWRLAGGVSHRLGAK
jgi:hypothetical protein